MEKIKELLLKYKEGILYLIFGVLTTIVNWIVYFVFYNVFSIHYLVSDVIAWILAVVFAFFTNKRFVFEDQNRSVKDYLMQGAKFVTGRLFSLGLELLLMWVFVDLILWNANIVKVLVAVVVVLVNYVISKLFVFQKGTTKDEEIEETDKEKSSSHE